jgi:hypothetical protein
MHEKEFRLMKFQAGLKGIDLEGNDTKSKFEEVKSRVQKKLADERSELAGTEAEVLDFASLGIEIESE